MPRREATVSEIMVPTKASVIATFSEAKKYGMERGSPTFIKMSRRDAPNARNTSSSSGSTVASPVAMFTAMGKNDTMNAVSTAGIVPAPNQMTNTGTTATFGILLNATSTGYKPRYTSRDDPISTPRAIPRTTASEKPINVDTNVQPAFSIIGAVHFCSEPTIAVGLGSRNSGISNSRQTASHITNKPMTKHQGMAFSRVRALIFIIAF